MLLIFGADENERPVFPLGTRPRVYLERETGLVTLRETDVPIGQLAEQPTSSDWKVAMPETWVEFAPTCEVPGCYVCKRDRDGNLYPRLP